jgi:hypothetical protein
MGTLGNHEGDGTMFRKYYPYDYIANHYYSFDYGPVKFIFVDLYTQSYAVGSPQYIWLENELSTNTKVWPILVMHEAAYCDSGHHGPNLTVRSIIHPLCMTYGVKLVLCGHNHYYSHCLADGVHWVTTGTGGAPKASVNGTGAGLVYSESQYHFAKVNIVGANLTIDVIDGTDGSSMETFTI